MADTRAATGLTVQQWDDKFNVEFFHDLDFKELMGEDENAVIQVKEDLTKKKGDSVTFALLNRLTNSATTGSAVLEGNEEDLVSRSHKLSVDKRRHGVRVSEMQDQASAVDIRNAMRPALKSWANENTRDAIIREMGSINRVAYASATEAQKDAWLVDNADRCLFGALASNNSSNDHSASLANIDNTADKLTRAAISQMKLLTRTCSPKIRPVRDPGNGKRTFIVYAHPYAFRDLRADLEAVSDDTTAAGQAMKLFEGGDLMWDGCIIKELDEMPLYSGVGAGGIVVAPVYLLGAQAIGYAVAKRWQSKTKEFDYGDKFGAAIDAIDGFEKLTYGSGAADTDDQKDNGIVSGFFAAVA
jgi:N4-gp56 family major capsid protein